MHIVDHRRHRKPMRAHRKVRRIFFVFIILMGLFTISNIAVVIVYHNKVLPEYTLGDIKIGGTTYADAERLLQAYELPSHVTLVKGMHKEQVPVAHLDIQIDKKETFTQVKKKPLLPLLGLFGSRSIALQLTTDEQKMSERLAILGAAFSQAATDRRVSFSGTNFFVEDAKGGYAFNSLATARQVVRQLSLGQQPVAVVTDTLPPGDATGDYTKQKDALQKQIQASITYLYGQQKIQPSASDLGRLYVHEGRSMVPSDAAITRYITQAVANSGGDVATSGDAALATRSALEQSRQLSFVLSPASAKKVTYCTAVRGVDAGLQSTLIQKLAITFADPRGWNASGKLAFAYATSGCEFTVWLAAPSTMTSFGAICDAYYSCNVGKNVVINYDRWQGATDPWNKQGLSIDEYRAMVINHEVGHWLGYDHAPCAAPGQPAPVMMQQSIELNGCTFNAWPVQKELDGVL